MKTGSRIAAIGLAALAAGVLLLSGCDKAPGSGEKPTPPPGKTYGPSNAPGQPVTGGPRRGG